MPSESVSISINRPSGQMPRGVKSSSAHTRSSLSSASTGCIHLKLSSLSLAGFQDMLDNLLVTAS